MSTFPLRVPRGQTTVDVELMGAKEAADVLGCSVSNLRRQRGLPEPVAELAMGSVWLGSEIRAMARERGKR